MLSHHDADLVRRDSAVPGLGVLLDPDAFIAALCLARPGLDICQAQNVYLRYKPATNCLAAYQLQIGDTSVDVFAKAYHRSFSGKLQKAKIKTGVSGPLETGQFILRENGIVVSVFPNDRKIRALEKLVDLESRERLLRKLLPESQRLWQGSVSRLRYKPERRCVVQLLADNRPEAVLRFYTENGYRNAWQSSKELASRGPLRIAGRLGRLNREHILAFGWLPGRSLTDLFAEDLESPATAKAVGSALAHLHEQTPKHPVFRTRTSEAKALVAVADGLAFISPQVGPGARNLAERLANLMLDTRPAYRLIHGDFYANQVLFDSGEVGIVDLDDAAYGDPAADLGNFIAHLHHSALCGTLPTERVEQLSSAFIEGYRLASPRTSTKGVQLYTAAGLLRLAPLPFRNRENEWLERIQQLVSQAGSILDASTGSGGVAHRLRTNHATVEIEIDQTRVIDSFGIENDSEMPLLKRATNPVEVGRLFEQNLRHEFHGSGRCSLSEIRVIRHKPGRRCLIEYQFRRKRSNKVGESFTLIGKSCANRVNIYAFQLSESLWREGFDDTSFDGVSISQPIGLVPELHMWVQRKMPGATLTKRLLQPAGLDMLRQTADALHKLHQTRIPTHRCHTLEDELRILHKRLGNVINKVPQWEMRIRQILDSCVKIGEHTATPAFCGIHRDFYPEQILIDKERIYLLDFDLYCQGDPALDIGNFLGHLIEFALRELNDPNALYEQQQAFEERYVEISKQVNRDSIHIYTTLTLARHIYLSTKFPERRKTTENLLDLCEERIAEHVCRSR